jgi:hypothetical protein
MPRRDFLNDPHMASGPWKDKNEIIVIAHLRANGHALINRLSRDGGMADRR